MRKLPRPWCLSSVVPQQRGMEEGLGRGSEVEARAIGLIREVKGNNGRFSNCRERKVISMARKISILLAVLIVIVSFLCVAQAQKEEKKGKKTIALPNGEVIWDISGEWDGFIQFYGTWAGQCGGTMDEKVKITQDGNSFVGTRMIDEWRSPKGSTILRGDLAKEGFKNVFYVGCGGNLMAGVQISEDGNEMEIDAMDKTRLTLRRHRERIAATPAGPKPEVRDRIKLRDKAEKNLSDGDLQKMIKERNFFNKQSNPEGHFPNDLLDNGNGTITDKVTGLMWQKGGSPSEMKFDLAVRYVEELNSSRFGGHGDWRLPTMEELCSLLEGTSNASGKFMDNLFDPAQSLCWSGDGNPRYRPSGVQVTVQVAFCVNFSRGETSAGVADKFAFATTSQGAYYVKAVRTAQ